MEKKKCYILESKCAKAFHSAVENRAYENEWEIDITSTGISPERLPVGYDLYFIHLSDVKEINDLKYLKSQQPESIFIDIGRGGGIFKGTEPIQLQNNMIITSERLKYILEKAN